jgi:hypothetical protein
MIGVTNVLTVDLEGVIFFGVEPAAGERRLEIDFFLKSAPPSAAKSIPLSPVSSPHRLFLAASNR